MGSARRRQRRPGLSAGRLVAAAVLAVIAALYVGPVQRYLEVRRQLNAQRAEVAALERRHAQLEQFASSFKTRATVIRYARSCGWVFPSETPIVVQGLPDGSLCNLTR